MNKLILRIEVGWIIKYWIIEFSVPVYFVIHTKCDIPYAQYRKGNNSKEMCHSFILMTLPIVYIRIRKFPSIIKKPAYSIFMLHCVIKYIIRLFILSVVHIYITRTRSCKCRANINIKNSTFYLMKSFNHTAYIPKSYSCSFKIYQ